MSKGDKAEVVYWGPYDALEIGNKRLIRGGPPVALTAAEFKRLQQVRTCKYEIAGDLKVQQPQPQVPEPPIEERLGAALPKHGGGEVSDA